MIKERIRAFFSKETGEGYLKKTIPFVLVLVSLISIGTTVYFYSQMVASRSGAVKKSSPEELQRLVDKVSQIILLPADEVPTVATVNDLALLKGQPFFTNAKVGDRVLIYPKAKKAILYNPDSNKIIEVAPVSPAAPEK